MTSTKNVLLIDDDPLFLSSVGRFIRAGGFSVTTAPSVKDALAAIASATFHVVVTDLFMPDVDGIGALKAIRSAAPHVPVIVFSGRFTEGTYASSLQTLLPQLGAAATVPKGDRPARLVETIRRVLDAQDAAPPPT